MADEGALAGVNHPAWMTAMATVGGYLAVLVVMTVLLFGVPYVLFAWL